MYNPLKFKGNESNFFFLSDLHWNHNPNWEIPIWKVRGFNSFEEYNEGLISTWNSVCDESSIVFHLGDLLFNDGEGKKFYQLIDRLRYKELYLLCGNHFSGQKQAYFNALGKVFPGLAQAGHCIFPFTSEINGRNITFLPQYTEVMINRDILILSHYRIYSWNYMAKNSIHLHGHQHLASLESDWLETKFGKMMDVGVESLVKYNSGAPISLDKVKKYMDKKPYKPEGTINMTNEERIANLERRVKELEEAANKQIPWTNPWKRVLYDGPNPWNPWPEPIDGLWPLDHPLIPDLPVDEGTSCPKCGVVWKGVMGYCCPDNKCPMGAGPVTC